jgi:hypothetical protein
VGVNLKSGSVIKMDEKQPQENVKVSTVSTGNRGRAVVV